MKGSDLFSIIDDRGVRVRVDAQRCAEFPRVRRRSVGSVAVDVFTPLVIWCLGLGVAVEVRPVGLSLAECAALLLGVCVTGWILLRWKLLPAMADGESASRTSAWLLFRGTCAACGYAIRGIDPEADGCAICPECGGAWNAVRWSSVKLPERGEGAAAEEDTSGRITIAAVDDRGVPLASKLEVPPRWLHRRDLPPSLRHDIEHRWRAAFSSWGGFVLVLSTIVCGGFSAIIAANTSGGMGDKWRMLLFIGSGVLFGGVVVLAAITLLVRSPGEWSLRCEWLAQGVCPNCGCAFAPDARPEFDGCTSCRECGRAWKR